MHACTLRVRGVKKRRGEEAGVAYLGHVEEICLQAWLEVEDPEFRVTAASQLVYGIHAGPSVEPTLLSPLLLHKPCSILVNSDLAAII